MPAQNMRLSGLVDKGLAIGPMLNRRNIVPIHRVRLEQDAEKCERFLDDIMLYFFESRADSDFRSNRPKIIRL
jgi:hypothetical protein